MSSDALEQLRKERSARYHQLGAEAKPKVAVCSACHQPSYRADVCPVTGLYHDLDKKKLIGGHVIDSKFIRSKDLMSAIDATRVRWVPSRTQLVLADAQSLNIFQSFAAQLEWNLQRYGILYGSYDAAQHVIEVHAIYEPEQHGSRFTFEAVPDPRIDKIDRLATGLGLRRVGVVCTHPPRERDVILLSAREMLLCAQSQSRFGDECVLLTVGPNDADGLVECQAWQTSPQCVHYYRLGVLQEPATFAADVSNAEAARNVESRVPLEIAQENVNAAGRRQFVTKAPSTSIDTRWFTSYIAVQQFESPVVRGLFMRITRPGMAPPTFRNLRNYMQDPKRKDVTFAEILADFHVLIFLAEVFSMEDDMPVLIEAARTKQMSEAVKNYETLVHEYCNANLA